MHCAVVPWQHEAHTHLDSGSLLQRLSERRLSYCCGGKPSRGSFTTIHSLKQTKWNHFFSANFLYWVKTRQNPTTTKHRKLSQISKSCLPLQSVDIWPHPCFPRREFFKFLTRHGEIWLYGWRDTQQEWSYMVSSDNGNNYKVATVHWGNISSLFFSEVYYTEQRTAGCLLSSFHHLAALHP